MEPRRAPLLAAAAPALHRLRGEAGARPCPRVRRGAKMATAMAAAGRSVLREGVVAGLIGAVVVAVWFLVFDPARGRPFLTPGLLGVAVFRRSSPPAALLTTQADDR